MPTTILLVDDHPVFRNGLRLLFEEEQDCKVVGEAGDGKEAINRVRELSPDVVIMDITMPNISGIGATRQIVSEFPETKILVLSIHSGKRFIEDMLRAGAVGYILKESAPEELLNGVRAVMRDEIYLSPAVTGVVVSEFVQAQPITEATGEHVGRTADLLRTKFRRPPISADIIPRLRLLELLEQGRHKPVTLISTPAGYGKSILASHWLETCGGPGAWVSLDENDNDLRTFLTYLFEAVQNTFSAATLETKTLLQAAKLPPAKVVAHKLLNDIEQLEESFILVLDDYHRIREEAVHDLLIELLRYPSPMLHLVLLARRDPPIPISSLRAGGQVTEITATDLRFTLTETLAFLERLLHFSIDEKTVSVLDEKVEGWVTGLRLVALAVSRKDELLTTIEGLKRGPYSFVQEYLIHEVLAHAPPVWTGYLLETSILDRFCAPLCEVLHSMDREQRESEEEDSGQSFIDWLEKTHLFVIPLDDTQRWFRYHHLFQQLLQKQLERYRNRDEIAELHFQASEWFESHDLIDEAIRHALAAGDAMRAAEVIEKYRNDEFTADRWYIVQRWLAMLPADIKQERPSLLLTEAWIAVLQHELTRVPMLLDRAESLVRSQTAEPTLSGEITFLRGYIAYFAGQAERSLQYLEDAVSQLVGTKSVFLGEAELMLGLARCMVGQNDTAVRALEARIGEVDSSEYYLLSRLIAGLAFIYLLWGDLHLARAKAQRLQRVSKKHHMRLAEAWSYYMLACTYLQNGEFEAASLHFAQAVELRYELEPRAAVDALAGLVVTQHLMRLDDEAVESWRRLYEFAQELHEPDNLSVAQSCRARLSLLRGDVTSAAELARSVSETPEPSGLFMWLEAPSITQARVQIAAGSEQSLLTATKQLQSIRDLCEECRFTCQIIEVTVLQSMALEKLGRADEALTVLEEAVAVAGPGGWIRPFVEAGPPMADLLKQLMRKNIAVDYIGKVLTAFRGDEQVAVQDVSEARAAPTVTASPQPLEDPLTNRELRILELLAQRLQNKEIAEELFVSPETVKTHLKNIYQKLQVSNRREAVTRAKDLGILTRR